MEPEYDSDGEEIVTYTEKEMPLKNAIEQGNLTEVKRIVESGMPINHTKFVFTAKGAPYEVFEYVYEKATPDVKSKLDELNFQFPSPSKKHGNVDGGRKGRKTRKSKKTRKTKKSRKGKKSRRV